MGAAALRHQVVLQFFDLLPVLLQLHLKLLNEAAEVTSHMHTQTQKNTLIKSISLKLKHEKAQPICK